MEKVSGVLIMTARNVLTFGGDNSSSSHTSKKKNILKLGEGLTFGIKATHGAAEKGLVLTLVKLAQNFA